MKRIKNDDEKCFRGNDGGRRTLATTIYVYNIIHKCVVVVLGEGASRNEKKSRASHCHAVIFRFIFVPYFFLIPYYYNIIIFILILILYAYSKIYIFCSVLPLLPAARPATTLHSSSHIRRRNNGARKRKKENTTETT